MNARDTALSSLKHLLTTGSLNTYLGSESLSAVSAVQRLPSAQTAQMQDLAAPSRTKTVPFPLAKETVPGLEVLLAPAEVITIDAEKRPRDSKVHLPKLKKQPKVDAPPALDPALHCTVCRCRYPNTYSEEDKQRHRAQAQTRECFKDTNDFRVRQRELKKMQQRLEREDLMNGEDQELKAKYGGIRTCPHCDENLEGRWGQFKKDHIESCSAKILDKELNKIVGESALIPKKAPELPPQPDPFAIAFTSLMRKRLPDGATR